MDIETVAEETPEKILKIPIDIIKGLSREQSQQVARFLEFKGSLVDKAAEEILKLWDLFLKLDAVQIEINPLAETDNGQVISVDAKLDFDDNARYRHEEIFEMEDISEIDPKEVEASKYHLNYVAMDGDIGCLGMYRLCFFRLEYWMMRFSCIPDLFPLLFRLLSEWSWTCDGNHGHY